MRTSGDWSPTDGLGASKNSLSRIRQKLGDVRNETIATISLMGFLILVFQIEVVLADQLGHSSSKVMLKALSREGKIVLAALAGPFLHQGNSHLLGNIGVLLVAGAYLEYAYGRSFLYLFYFGVGYLASWAPLFLGSVGAVGASGVTYGLGAWMMIHATWRVFERAHIGRLDQSLAHIFPFLFGAGNTIAAVEVLLNGTINGAGDVTHLFGAFLGLVFGFKLLMDHYEIRWRIPSLR